MLRILPRSPTMPVTNVRTPVIQNLHFLLSKTLTRSGSPQVENINAGDKINIYKESLSTKFIPTLNGFIWMIAIQSTVNFIEKSLETSRILHFFFPFSDGESKLLSPVPDFSLIPHDLRKVVKWFGPDRFSPATKLRRSLTERNLRSSQTQRHRNTWGRFVLFFTLTPPNYGAWGKLIIILFLMSFTDK